MFSKTGSSSSTSVPALMKDEEPRNWEELPSELTSSIMVRLGAIEILENAKKVCTWWRRVSKDPSMWRKIDMHNTGDMRSMKCDFESMCRHAVDRSQGGLVELDICDFGTDNLLNYITDRSSNLRSLRLVMCKQITDEGFAKAVVKLPLLEELDVSYCAFSGEILRVVGQSCPNLKTLKLNRSPATFFFYLEHNDIAIAVAETMPELRHLQLFGDVLNNTGLIAILEGCPHLEHLDIRRCFKIKLGDIEKRFYESIRVLRRPYDLPADYPFVITTYPPECSDDDSDDIYCDSDDVDYEFSCPSPSDDYYFD